MYASTQETSQSIFLTKHVLVFAQESEETTGGYGRLRAAETDGPVFSCSERKLCEE